MERITSPRAIAWFALAVTTIWPSITSTVNGGFARTLSLMQVVLA